MGGTEQQLEDALVRLVQVVAERNALKELTAVEGLLEVMDERVHLATLEAKQLLKHLGYPSHIMRASEEQEAQAAADREGLLDDLGSMANQLRQRVRLDLKSGESLVKRPGRKLQV